MITPEHECIFSSLLDNNLTRHSTRQVWYKHDRQFEALMHFSGMYYFEAPLAVLN